MSINYSGKLYSAQEVEELLYGWNADPRTVTKELSRNDIQIVHGWPAEDIDALAEFRALSKEIRARHTFAGWRALSPEERALYRDG